MVKEKTHITGLFYLGVLCILCFASAAEAEIDLRIRGNDSLSTRRIRQQIPDYPTEWTAEQVQLWREDAVYSVEQFYQDRGYFDVRVRVQTIRRDENTWQAFMDIHEGARYSFGPVQIILKDSLSSAPGQFVDTSQLNVHMGNFFSERPILKDRLLLLRQYGDAGYVHVQVQDSVSIDDSTKIVSVKYVVNPSYAVVFDTLIIQNTREAPFDSLGGITSDQLLRDLFPYTLGDTVRARQNDSYIEKLQSTGVFNFVRIRDTLLKKDPNRSAMILVAEEHVPGELRSSAFYETQYGLGISLDLSHGNVNGSLNEVQLGGTLASDKQSSYIGFGAPLIFNYMVRFDTDLQVSWYQNAAIHEQIGAEMFGGSFEAVSTTRLSRSFTDWVRLVTSAELLAQRIIGSSDSIAEIDDPLVGDLDTLQVGDTLEGVTLNFISTVFFSFLDDLLNPTDGSRYAITWGNGGTLIEAGEWSLLDNRHNWFEINSAYYYPIISQIRMAARLDGGIFLDDGGLNARRFYLGGPRNIRAFGFREIEPAQAFVDDELVPLYWLASLEARIGLFDFGYINENSFFSFMTELDIVPFVDYGQLYDRSEPLDDPLQKTGWALSYGVGLRYPLLGIFNLRVDFAWGYTYHNGERITAREFRERQAPDEFHLPFALVIDLSQAF
ncbi:MAG: BamA/TamA family outer membrane protein [Chitinivibrionales bacterium]